MGLPRANSGRPRQWNSPNFSRRPEFWPLCGDCFMGNGTGSNLMPTVRRTWSSYWTACGSNGIEGRAVIEAARQRRRSMRSKGRWIIVLVALWFAGGARIDAQQTTPRRLSLRDAIDLALRQNLSVRVASTQVEELEGTRDRRRASLLPHVNGDAIANRENIDLGAM